MQFFFLENNGKCFYIGIGSHKQEIVLIMMAEREIKTKENLKILPTVKYTFYVTALLLYNPLIKKKV